MRVVRFQREHMKWLAHQPGHEHYKSLIASEENLSALEQAPHSHSIIDGGVVLACLGLAQYWPGRCEAWVAMNSSCGGKFFKVHNIVKNYLATAGVLRVEAAVAIDGFFQAHRWVRALGFKLETECATAFLPGGKDARIYVRVE